MKAKPTRRSFFGHAGAALTAPFAATIALAGEHDGRRYLVGRTTAREDIESIRALQLRFAQLAGRTGAGRVLEALFADPSRASVDEHVRSVVIDGDDAISISSDGMASAQVPCIVTTATPIEDCGTLAEMARLQGDGIVARSYRRVLETTYVKRGGMWKIDRVTYRSA
jgi:hypothetical protein